MDDWRKKAEEMGRRLDERDAHRKQSIDGAVGAVKAVLHALSTPFRIVGEAKDAVDSYFNPTDDQKQEWHQHKYQCHICGKPSSGPSTYSYYSAYSHSVGEYVSSNWETGTDWWKPQDLRKCRVCHQWTCSEHISANGVCINHVK